MPEKTDTTTPCLKCGAVMNISLVTPDEGMMLHTFVCTCGEEAKFTFPKKVVTAPV